MLCLTAAAMQGGQCHRLIKRCFVSSCVRFSFLNMHVRGLVHWPIRASPLLLPCGHMFRYISCKVHPTHHAWWFRPPDRGDICLSSLSYCFLAP
ncbi:hypothetical protein V8C40DRAFT_96772 [Trichoderma camerunense]